MIDNKRTALIIVDVQNDFCTGGALAVQGSDAIITPINILASRFDTVVATKDWHPGGHISFASSHAGKEVNDSIETGYGAQHLWPDHCVQGTRGAELHPDINRQPLTATIHKGCARERDSYSAFFESDGVTATGLEGYLRARGIESVAVCGLATEYCVMASALGGLECGFTVYVVTDAIAGINTSHTSSQQALDTMSAAGIQLTAAAAIA